MGETIKTVDGNNADAIKKLIEKTYHPEITIDVNYNTKQQYDDPGKGKEKVDVYEHDFKINDYDENTEYIQLVHSQKDGILFKPRAIKQGVNELGGIPTSGILKTVTAYYCKCERERKTPLVIELATGVNEDEHIYYHKERRGAQWSQYTILDSELTGQSLKKKLNVLKAIHLSESSTYSVRMSSHEGGRENQHGDQPFNYTALWSSLVCLGGVGAIGVVVYKFWPTIKRVL